MNPLAILSLSCFALAACLFIYWLRDRRRLMRGLAEDAELDHWPVRSSRSSPEWMRRFSAGESKRNRIKTKP